MNKATEAGADFNKRDNYERSPKTAWHLGLLIVELPILPDESFREFCSIHHVGTQ